MIYLEKNGKCKSTRRPRDFPREISSGGKSKRINLILFALFVEVEEMIYNLANVYPATSPVPKIRQRHHLWGGVRGTETSFPILLFKPSHVKQTSSRRWSYKTRRVKSFFSFALFSLADGRHTPACCLLLSPTFRSS